MWRTVAVLAVSIGFLLFAVPPGRALAKRAAPPQVKPVVVDDIEYSAQSELLLDGGKPAGSVAYLVASDVKSKKTLWKLPVYEVRFDRSKETDVQDVRIALIEAEGTNLVIQNERKQEFLVDTKAKSVRGLIR